MKPIPHSSNYASKHPAVPITPASRTCDSEQTTSEWLPPFEPNSCARRQNTRREPQPPQQKLFGELLGRFGRHDLMTKSSEGLSRQDATLLQLASVEFARRFALAKEIRARLTATDVQIIMDRHRGFLGIVLMLGEELEAFIIRDYIYLLFMRSDDAVINTVVRSYRILDKIKRDRKYQNYMESIRTFYKTWGFIGHEYRIADQLDGLEVNIRKKLRDRQSSRQRFIDDILPKWMAWSSNYCARSNIRTIRRVYNSAEVVRADEEYSTISRIFGTALATENIIKSAIARAVFSEGDIDIFSATL